MRIVLSAAVRNCALYLEKIFDEINAGYVLFHDFKYVFVESDSKDGSDESLRRFNRVMPHGDVILLGKLRRKIPLRTDRLALARENCLNFMRKLQWNSADDYFVVLDCDNTGVGFSLSAIKDAICAAKFEWDALFANSEEPYHDIFALRHPVWNSVDCWEQVRERPPFMSREDAINLFIASKRITISPDADPILVESAFGGLGIYRIRSLAGASYKMREEYENEYCEHLNLHEGMRKRGFDKLYIYPKLILNPKPPEKTRRRLKSLFSIKFRKNC